MIESDEAFARDPRVDPARDDVLDLLGWKAEVVCVLRDGDGGTVDSWIGATPHVPRELRTQPLDHWRENMRHATVRKVA